MRVAYAQAVALLLAVAAVAQPPEVVIVPPGPPVPAVKWVPVSGEARVSSDILLSAGVKSEWALIDAGPTLRVSADGMTATIRSETPGTFRLLVIADGKAQFRTVTIGGPGPLPPGPNPLRDRLKAAYEADPLPLPQRKEKALLLAALYTECAELAGSDEVMTSGELLERLRQASARILKDKGDVNGSPLILVPLRKAVGLELRAILATDDAPLTADQRRDLAKLFRDIAGVLEGF